MNSTPDLSKRLANTWWLMATRVVVDTSVSISGVAAFEGPFVSRIRVALANILDYSGGAHGGAGMPGSSGASASSLILQNIAAQKTRGTRMVQDKHVP